MTTPGSTVWTSRQASIVGAFELLAARVRERIPEVVSNISTSTNNVKPIDVVRTFQLPGRHNPALVLSTMFTFFGGTLSVHCDLMQEDGPILLDLGPRDLGAGPTDDVVDAFVAGVVEFAGSSEETIVAALQTQYG